LSTDLPFLSSNGTSLHREMGVIKSAIADGLLTFLWVFCSSNIGVSTYFIASYFGVAKEIASLFITTLIVFLIFLVFGFLGDVLGGAGFNPTGNAAFYAAGLGDDSLVSAAVRCPAQVFLLSFSLEFYW